MGSEQNGRKQKSCGNGKSVLGKIRFGFNERPSFGNESGRPHLTLKPLPLCFPLDSRTGTLIHFLISHIPLPPVPLPLGFSWPLAAAFDLARKLSPQKMRHKNENTGPENTGPENETPAAAAAWLLAMAAQTFEPVDILPAESVRPVDVTAKRIAAKLPAGRIGPVYCFDSEADAKAVAREAARAADQRRRFAPAVGSIYARYYFACLVSLDAVPVTLETATVAELAAEIHKRQAAALIIEPSDVAEYWECDESGATSPATDVPDGETWDACRRAFERWIDSGAFTEAMEAMRDAWNGCNGRRNGKRPWNGIDENTKDPLESDDDAPDLPSELGNPFEADEEEGESK